MNNKPVMQTQWVHLDAIKGFEVPIDSSSAIAISQRDSPTVEISILESYNISLANTIEIARITLPVDGKNVNREMEQTVAFKSKKMLSYSHTAVGSRIPDDPYGSSATEGSLLLKYEVRAEDSLNDNEGCQREDEKKGEKKSSVPVVDPNNPHHLHMISSLQKDVSQIVIVYRITFHLQSENAGFYLINNVVINSLFQSVSVLNEWNML